MGQAIDENFDRKIPPGRVLSSDIHALEKVRAVVFQGRSVLPANRG